MKPGLASAFVLFSGAWSSVASAQGYGAPYGQNQQNQGGSDLESGGLAPPSPMEQPPESARTEQQLNEAEEKDTGRGLEFFYLNVEGGFEHLGLETFKADNLVDTQVVSTKQTGWVVGAGLGLRVIFLTIGPRFRLASFSDFQLWTLNGELGIHIPLGNFEPYFHLGAGFASMGSFSADNIGAGLNSNDVDITGYNIRAGGGMDYYVTPVFSVGANVSWELLGLTRPGVIDGGAAGGGGAQASVYAADGSSLGSAFTGTAVLGLHF